MLFTRTICRIFRFDGVERSFSRKNIGIEGCNEGWIRQRGGRVGQTIYSGESPSLIIENALALSWMWIPPSEISIGKMSVSMFCLRIFATQT